MKLGVNFRNIARASQQAIARVLGGHKDAHLSFISYHSIPELRTLAVAPDEIHSEKIIVTYSHEHRRLKVIFSKDDHVSFIFREEDIMVLSSNEFDKIIFQERLFSAIFSRQESKTIEAPQHFPLRG